MGFRFQRRIRLIPGVRLNVSKSGLGLSLGPRGSTVSVGQSGLYGNAGLPGTGLSFRQKLNTKNNQAIRKSYRKEFENYLLSGEKFEIGVEISDNGEIAFLDKHEQPLLDEELKVLKKLAPQQLRSLLEMVVNNKNQTLKAIAQIHHSTPNSTQTVFVKFPYSEPFPELKNPVNKSFWQKIWPPSSKRIDADNAEIKTTNQQLQANWESRKAAHDKSEIERKILETDLVATDINAMIKVLEHHLAAIDWPLETDINFDFGKDFRNLIIDIEVPSPEQMPNSEWSISSSQYRVSRKKMSDAKIRIMFGHYVHGAILRIFGEIFLRLPSLEVACVSCYYDKLSTLQNISSNFFLISVIADKDRWNNLNLSNLKQIDPTQVFEQFEIRRKMTKTCIFSEIKPFSENDLEKLL
jgi:hypothetical protein